MAQKPDTARNASGMERVGKRKLGYNISQVDTFLERAHKLYESDDARLTQQDIQDVSFELERNGYVIGQVDAALSRLERAVVDKCTEHELSECGRVVWKARVEELYRKLLQHAQRDYRNRFDEGVARRPSYARKQVDIMVDQALDKIAFMLGHELEWETDEDTLKDIDADYVSNVVFTQRTGKHGYDERQVDYYLNACIRLLSSLESFERLEQYSDSDNAYSNSYSNSSVNSDQKYVVSPSLADAVKSTSSAADSPSAVQFTSEFVDDSAAADALPKVMKAPSVPNVPDHDKQSIFAPVDYNNKASDNSFESLHQSERAIFTPHAAAGNSANSIDDTDSNDELLQSATVMHNTSEATNLPPAFPPVVNNHDQHEDKPAESANSAANGGANGGVNGGVNGGANAPIPSFPPSAPSQNTSLPLPPLPVPDFSLDEPLKLEVPDISFPLMGHVDESDANNGEENEDNRNGDRA